jgi:hypothetical protein
MTVPIPPPQKKNLTLTLILILAGNEIVMKKSNEIGLPRKE